MKRTPLAEQPKIVLCGLRNVGKSSLINALFNQEVAIVSEVAGTTTDPITKSMELGALGNVAIIDTAGVDDEGKLGGFRVAKTKEKLDIADIIILVSRQDKVINSQEIELIKNYHKKNLLIACTHNDLEKKWHIPEEFMNTPIVYIDTIKKTGIHELKEKIIALFSQVEQEITPVQGLVKENDLVLLVTPIDAAAPKGRLILPQVETIRDLLDRNCSIVLCKENNIEETYRRLKERPALVITDSQAFHETAAKIPEDQLLTSFSILFARKKGELEFFMQGIKKLKEIKIGAKILILESCSHHKQEDDIGSVKIPCLFRDKVQSQVEFVFAKKIPSEEELKEYALVINCAGCMVTRNAMMQRINILKNNQTFGTNYGLFLAWAHGLLPRALEPFPYEYSLWDE